MKVKLDYNTPVLETKEFAQFENVFTYCDKNPSETCVNVTGSGHDMDKPLDRPESETSAHGSLPWSGGGS